MDYNSDDLYDEYEGEDYEQGEDELSPEDQASMAQGTEDVKAQLGEDANKVTTKQIHDALWHYYYDIEKSVSYLKNKYISPPPPKPSTKKAPEGMFHALSFTGIQSMLEVAPGAEWRHFETRRQLDSDTSCIRKFDFSDMPWMNVPKDRLSTFIPPPTLPGGLLGGSDKAPKISKLQALAAARKKKAEEKKEQEQVAQGVGKLSVSDPPKKENILPVANLAKRQKTTDHTSSLPSERPQPLSETPENHKEPETTVTKPPPTQSDIPLVGDDVVEVVQSGQPSAFAQTIFGSAPGPSKPRKAIYPMPHTASPDFDVLAFSKPSPDDIVLAAQSQGSNFAKPK